MVDCILAANCDHYRYRPVLVLQHIQRFANSLLDFCDSEINLLMYQKLLCNKITILTVFTECSNLFYKNLIALLVLGAWFNITFKMQFLLPISLCKNNFRKFYTVFHGTEDQTYVLVIFYIYKMLNNEKPVTTSKLQALMWASFAWVQFTYICMCSLGLSKQLMWQTCVFIATTVQ